MQNVKNVVVMVYRDTAIGGNGIINSVSTEINLDNKYITNVTIAVETKKSSEGNYISFYEERVDKVYVQNSGNSIFSGFAIHNVVSWMILKK